MEKKTVTVLNLGDPELESLIMQNLYDSMSSGYITRCYCRSCYRSYDATKNGIKLLERKNPEDPIVLPEGIDDIHDEAQAARCFLVMEPCFMCREKEQKIITTAHLIPEKKSLLNDYSKNPLNGHNGRNHASQGLNGHSIIGQKQIGQSSVSSQQKD